MIALSYQLVQCYGIIRQHILLPYLILQPQVFHPFIKVLHIFQYKQLVSVTEISHDYNHLLAIRTATETTTGLSLECQQTLQINLSLAAK